jgi:hypothetical protein
MGNSNIQFTVTVKICHDDGPRLHTPDENVLGVANAKDVGGKLGGDVLVLQLPHREVYNNRQTTPVMQAPSSV